jgi:hypothetical protein
MFASLEFGSPTAVPDDTDPIACVAHHADLCTGILLFDIWIANPDRHIGNLRVDDPVIPTTLDIFDHDHALFGVFEQEGTKRLAELSDRLGISGGSATGENRHCLLDALDTKQYMSSWIERIREVPDWYVADVCQEVVQVGATSDEAAHAVEFLLQRAENLNELIWNNRKEFAGVRDWGLFNEL